MAKAEAKRPDGIEAVAIVTPNHMHYPAAKAFLEAGIHVICDKPLTSTLGDAKKLAALVEKTGKLFILTHNYTGYPMVRQAREMVQGAARRHPLGPGGISAGLADGADRDYRPKQAAWRIDPKQSGAGGSTGDIGTHAYNLARFVTGLELDSLSADLDAFVPGRKLDDNAHVMLRFKPSGNAPAAKGMLWASQVAVGHENGLKLRVYGTKGGIEWVQADPNYLWFTPFGEPKHLITRGGAGASRSQPASRACRPATPRAISKASPTSMRKPRAPSAPPVGRSETAEGRHLSRPSQMASRAWPSSRLASTPHRRTRLG